LFSSVMSILFNKIGAGHPLSQCFDEKFLKEAITTPIG